MNYPSNRHIICLYNDTQLVTLLKGIKTAETLEIGEILISAENNPIIIIDKYIDKTQSKWYKLSFGGINKDQEYIYLHESNMVNLYNVFLNNYIKISIKDLLTKNKIWIDKHEIFFNKLEFIETKTLNNPYYFGIFISLILEKEFGDNQDLGDTIIYKKYRSNISDYTEIMNLLNYYIIPDIYLYNSITIRNQVLKGIFDGYNILFEENSKKNLNIRLNNIIKNTSDLSLNSILSPRYNNTIDRRLYYIHKVPAFNEPPIIKITNKLLLDQIRFLCKSLNYGFKYENNILHVDFVEKNNYYSFKISNEYILQNSIKITLFEYSSIITFQSFSIN
jgi:hypothetical protein